MTDLIPIQKADAGRGGVHYDPGAVPLDTLWERIEILDHYNHPRSLGEALSRRDPRCGCSSDNEGGMCEWDDVLALELVHAIRMAAAA